MKSTDLTAEQVGELTEKYLEKHQPADYRILIERSGIKQDEDGWWEVPISASKEDVESSDWVGRSAEAAEEMDETEGVHVLFV